MDGLAHKVALDWLRRWLEDPFAYLPASKMPQVVLAPRELDDLMSFLLDQTPDPPLIPLPNLVADPYQGARLFKERACQQCHAAVGEGGAAGPALDRLGRKTSRRWLNNFLGTHAQNADHNLTDQETADLSAFLVRRFAAGGEVPDECAPARPASAAIKRGLATAIERQALVQALQYANALSTDTALPHDYWQGSVPPPGRTTSGLFF